MAKILVLDDEQPLLQSVRLSLERAGHEVYAAETGGTALRLLEKESIDLAILDVQLPDITGLEVLKNLRSEMPEVPVIIITAFASVETAVEAMKEGSIDYLEKPLDLEELAMVVQRELSNAQLRSEVEAYRRNRVRHAGKELIGASRDMADLRKWVEQVSQVAVNDVAELPTILLLGETGTGKDLLARTIHDSGPLAKKPFVSINCGSLPRDLVESELFGHEKGAFTSADQRKQGLFEVAEGGTVFLNEIGNIPLDLQTRLLTAIETKMVRRIGGVRERRLRVRIIAATNRNLEEAVAAGEFRTDLYYRLRVLHYTLSPLRERREDIAALARHFVGEACARYGKPALQITEEELQPLLAWHWPGNVRELAHTAERMVLLSEGHSLGQPGLAPLELRAGPSGPPSALPLDFGTEPRTLHEIERTVIEAALSHTGGNVSQVARLLGLTRGALRHKMTRLGVQGDG